VMSDDEMVVLMYGVRLKAHPVNLNRIQVNTHFLRLKWCVCCASVQVCVCVCTCVCVWVCEWGGVTYSCGQGWVGWVCVWGCVCVCVWVGGVGGGGWGGGLGWRGFGPER